jgi:regulator of protease activity HflC (stomatin/prohibitin superfamily)
MKQQIIDLPKQTVITKDNIVAYIDANVAYRIVDSKQATY